MKKLQNEGLIERIIQATISVTLFLGAFFWTSGNWQVFLFSFSLIVAVFASIGFCPLYVIIGKKNRLK